MYKFVYIYIVHMCVCVCVCINKGKGLEPMLFQLLDVSPLTDFLYNYMSTH